MSTISKKDDMSHVTSSILCGSYLILPQSWEKLHFFSMKMFLASDPEFKIRSTKKNVNFWQKVSVSDVRRHKL
jgi:hypothetical protein